MPCRTERHGQLHVEHQLWNIPISKIKGKKVNIEIAATSFLYFNIFFTSCNFLFQTFDEIPWKISFFFFYMFLLSIIKIMTQNSLVAKHH